MEQKDDGMLGKLKTTISIIYGILLWVVKLSSTIKVPPHYYLGAVISSTSQLQKNDDRKKHSFIEEFSPTPSPTCSSSPSSFSLSSEGDLIGSESGVYMSSSKDALLGEQGIQNANSDSFYRKKKSFEKEIGKKTGLPPPLTSLVSAKNLTCRVPWVFDKYYVDGRLIVKEKRAKRAEYFETYRENGRLIMNLVPFDDTFDCNESVDIDIGSEKNETFDRFSNNIEEEGNYDDEDMSIGEGNYEDEEMPIDEMECPILESSIEKRCNKEREKSLLNPKKFHVPIHV